jgi:transposase-like protein
MSNEKRRAFDGKFKERAVALAKERKNVSQAARELEISGSLLRTWIAAAEPLKPEERASQALLKINKNWSDSVSSLQKPKRSSKS